MRGKYYLLESQTPHPLPETPSLVPPGGLLVIQYGYSQPSPLQEQVQSSWVQRDRSEESPIGHNANGGHRSELLVLVLDNRL